MACKHKKRLWENGWCNVACRYCTFTQENSCEHNKQTNADRIRAMSDEELADILTAAAGGSFVTETRRRLCYEKYLDFLKQPVKDGDNDD